LIALSLPALKRDFQERHFCEAIGEHHFNYPTRPQNTDHVAMSPSPLHSDHPHVQHQHPLSKSLLARDTNQPTPSLSPSLIVGICILSAIFFCVVLASIIRMCSRATGPGIASTAPNLFTPYDPSQLERLAEVRRIHNMMAWERGRWAKQELLKRGRRLTVGMEEMLDRYDQEGGGGGSEGQVSSTLLGDLVPDQWFVVLR
jgi:hypothetical protein